MQPFQSLLGNVPHTLAFQDALSNSVGGAPSTTGTGLPAGAPGSAASGTSPSGFNPLFMFAIVVGVWILFMVFNSGKEKKRRAQLLASIKKGEKVLTIGGIIGTVADVRDDEVTLRIDENSNVKMRFTRSSIQQVLKSAPDAESGGASGGAKGGAKVEIEAKNGKSAKVAV